MPDENNQNPPEELSIEELKTKNEELLNNWKRAAADLENYRKRRDQEGKELLEFAKEMTVMKLLPSLQNLEQVLHYAPEDEKYKDWITGLKATIQQLEKTLEEMGLKKIKTVGEKFDLTRHEAVGHTDGEDEMILEEVQPGFTLHDRVVLPAKVVVGKKGENNH